MAIAPVLDIDHVPTQVAAIDLTMVKRKLTDTEEGPGWSPDRAAAGEQEYRRFLQLKLLYPDEDIVPDAEVDAFWHQHILDTRAYASDSAALFGDFLHHDPYFGLASVEERAELHAAFRRTRELYRQHFGDGTVGGPKKCHSCRPTRCK